MSDKLENFKETKIMSNNKTTEEQFKNLSVELTMDWVEILQVHAKDLPDEMKNWSGFFSLYWSALVSMTKAIFSGSHLSDESLKEFEENHQFKDMLLYMFETGMKAFNDEAPDIKNLIQNIGKEND